MDGGRRDGGIDGELMKGRGLWRERRRKQEKKNVSDLLTLNAVLISSDRTSWSKGSMSI